MPGCHDHLPPVDLDRISAVSVLSGEHRVILQTIDCLVAIAARAEREAAIPRPHADQALEIIRRFADQCHHAKEEDLLFPALEELAPDFGPTAVMRHEHVLGREFVAAMDRAVTEGAVGAFAVAAHGYADLLRAHIHKEDEILFRMAQQMLSPQADAEILRAYRALEHDDMGDGTHERLLGLADSLAAAYDVPRASAEPRIMSLLTAVCGCHDAPPPAAPAAWQRKAGELRFLAHKVANRHGPEHPDMPILAEAVEHLADSGKATDARALVPRLRQLTNDFTPWPGACASVWQLLYGLKEAVELVPTEEEVA